MDRREFLAFTGSAAAGCTMGRKAMGAVGKSRGLSLTLHVEGDKASGFAVVVLLEGKPITTAKAGSSRRDFKTASAAWTMPSPDGKRRRGPATIQMLC